MFPVYINTPFGFGIDLSFWLDLFSLPPMQIVNQLFAIVGWTAAALVFFWMGAELWVSYRTSKYTKSWQWVLLAVDIPALYVQSPKAVEQIFAHLSGAGISNNIAQKYWKGRKQKWFSLEIISIEGYIQFLIRTESEFRDLVEAAVYAQYPEAEITEVEDYISQIPTTYPSDTHDVFAVEFRLADNDAYPIRTYPSFEYSISKDSVFSDPMAAVLENFSRIGKGENLWFQIIIEPTGNSWKEKGIELVKKIVANKKEKKKETLLPIIGQIPKIIAQEAINVWEWNFPPYEDTSSPEAPAGKVTDLTPGGKDTIKAIEEKISKIGFKTKVRLFYAAEKESYGPQRCIDGFVGALNQFHVMNRNAIIPHAITETHYLFKDSRLNKMKTKYAEAYKKRKLKTGASPYILNIEELATIWHFPLPFVKTPLMQKAETKRGEPPTNLPVENMSNRLKLSPPKKTESEPVEEVLPPELPYA